MKNETHESRTDPEARLMRKGKEREARLSFMGLALMENGNGLLMDFMVSRATGTAEREAVPVLLDDARQRAYRPKTLGVDKDTLGYRRTHHEAWELQPAPDRLGRLALSRLVASQKLAQAVMEAEVTSKPGPALASATRSGSPTSTATGLDLGHPREHPGAGSCDAVRVH